MLKYILIGFMYGLCCIYSHNIFPYYISEFLTSIGMWTFVAVFPCRKIKDNKKSILFTVSTMCGIFAGYYLGYILQAKVNVFSFYEIFWILVALAFSTGLGIIIYLENSRNIKIQNILLPCIFWAEAFWKMKDRHFSIFWSELLDCPLLILAGIIVFIYYNKGNLKDIKLYIKSVLLFMVLTTGISTVYQILYFCLSKI